MRYGRYETERDGRGLSSAGTLGQPLVILLRDAAQVPVVGWRTHVLATKAKTNT